MTKKINPFPPRSIVRFRRCDKPSCLCHAMISDDGSTGTVKEKRGNVVIVDFVNLYGGFMEIEVGFRLEVAELHLERVGVLTR